MKDELNTKLDDFLMDEQEIELDEKIKEQKKELLNTKTGLIERVDKVYVTNDGRQLLREQY